MWVFRFTLPESALPCSFESRAGQIRYFFKVTIDIPYASPPQGMKYFTIIGPHIDCMDEQYLVSINTLNFLCKLILLAYLNHPDLLRYISKISNISGAYCFPFNLC